MLWFEAPPPRAGDFATITCLAAPRQPLAPATDWITAFDTAEQAIAVHNTSASCNAACARSWPTTSCSLGTGSASPCPNNTFCPALATIVPGPVDDVIAQLAAVQTKHPSAHIRLGRESTFEAWSS
ncbi:hypothetical protein ACWF0M_12645 [Kribbella sp. NPDC055110]